MECVNFPQQGESENLCMDPQQSSSDQNVRQVDQSSPKNIRNFSSTRQSIVYLTTSKSLETTKPFLESKPIYSKFDKCDCQCHRNSMFRTLISTVNAAATVTIYNASYCTYACSTGQSYDSFVSKILATVSFLLLTSSLLVLAAFLIDPSRFDYPERPVVYMHICFLMLATVYLTRVQFGSSISCKNDRILVNVIDNLSAPCGLQFFLIYFFTLSALLWWTMATFLRLLSSFWAWSKEAIDSYAAYYHIFAWSIPFLITVSALIFNVIDGDPYTGICFLGNTNTTVLSIFLLYPIAICLGLTSMLILLDLLSLFRVWTIVRLVNFSGQNSQNKLPKLMLKNVVQLFSFSLPLSITVAVLYYEIVNKQDWMASKVCNPKCGFLADWKFFDWKFLILKHILVQITGIISALWYLSSKTFKTCAKMLKKLCLPKNSQNLALDDGFMIEYDDKCHTKIDTVLLTTNRDNFGPMINISGGCPSVGYYRNFYDRNCHSQLLGNGSSSGFSQDNHF